MMARISEDFRLEKPTGAVALVDGWLFGEGSAPQSYPLSMRQRDNINYKPDCPLCEFHNDTALALRAISGVHPLSYTRALKRHIGNGVRSDASLHLSAGILPAFLSASFPA